MKRLLLVALSLSLLLSAAFGQLNFVSTQFHPATEREYFEGSLLPSFTKLTNVKVQFLPLTYEEASTRIRAEQSANRVSIGLFAELQGGMELMASGGLLKDISGVTFNDRTFISTFEKFAQGYGIKQFVPWLQATFVMVVNKKAFDYLPKGLT
ncbi:MAG: extracellular solute-binding protein, partial [Thermotogaceae bacterium]|nr:extracellular solute-binding protein [Thermotogaceae bacterium]